MSDSAGTVKVVIVDSVTAVVSPLLGGQQREGECCVWQSPGSGMWSRLPAPESSLRPAQPPLPPALLLCSSSSRLGPDDAAGPGAEDPGAGPRRGGAGEEVRLAGRAVSLLVTGLPQGEEEHGF